MYANVYIDVYIYYVRVYIYITIICFITLVGASRTEVTAQTACSSLVGASGTGITAQTACSRIFARQTHTALSNSSLQKQIFALTNRGDNGVGCRCAQVLIDNKKALDIAIE